MRVTVSSSAMSAFRAGVVSGRTRSGAAKFMALAGEITISMGAEIGRAGSEGESFRASFDTVLRTCSG